MKLTQLTEAKYASSLKNNPLALQASQYVASLMMAHWENAFELEFWDADEVGEEVVEYFDNNMDELYDSADFKQMVLKMLYDGLT